MRRAQAAGGIRAWITSRESARWRSSSSCRSRSSPRARTRRSASGRQSHANLHLYPEHMTMIRNVKVLAVLLALTAPALTACNKTETILGPDPNRVYTQIERLGNPLVSEVFLAKRDHGFFNAGAPSTDVANFKAKLEEFVRTVAGRNTTVQTDRKS